MRILHIADLHLGKTVNEISMISDQRDMLEKILGIIEEKKADALVIAGDIYDRSIPPEEAVKLFGDFLAELAARKIQVLAISGNHDSDERIQFGAPLFEDSGIHIAGTFDGKAKKVTLEDADGPVNFFLLPFIKASVVRYYYPEEKEHLTTYEDAVKLVLSKADLNPEERNVMVAHQFVTADGKDPELSGSESAGAEEVGTVERIGSSVFAPFDYTALGHIHGAQAVGSDYIRYSGSPLKYSLREINQKKSAVLVDLGKKTDGKTEIRLELIPLKPLHEMRHIRGSLKDLLHHAEDTEDYIWATLTDEEPIMDAMSVLQGTYPNAMRLDYDNSHTRSLEQADLAAAVGNRSFADVVSDFSRMMLERDLTEDERQLLHEAAVEAGILED